MKYNKNKEKLFAILPFVKDEYIWEEKKKRKGWALEKKISILNNLFLFPRQD